jgi:hypothetical protein
LGKVVGIINPFYYREEGISRETEGIWITAYFTCYQKKKDIRREEREGVERAGCIALHCIAMRSCVVCIPQLFSLGWLAGGWKVYYLNTVF